MFFEDLQFQKYPEKYDWERSYAQAKAANILFVRELAKIFEDVVSISVHPGVIKDTNMGSAVPTEWWIKLGFLNPDGTEPTPSAFKTIDQGASTQIIAAFDPTLVNSSGAFLNDGAIYDDPNRPLPSFVTSDEDAKKLWDVSEETWGIKFGARL